MRLQATKSSLKFTAKEKWRTWRTACGICLSGFGRELEWCTFDRPIRAQFFRLHIRRKLGSGFTAVLIDRGGCRQSLELQKAADQARCCAGAGWGDGCREIVGTGVSDASWVVYNQAVATERA